MNNMHVHLLIPLTLLECPVNVKNIVKISTNSQFIHADGRCWCVSWYLWVFTCSSSLDSVQTGTTALYIASQNGHFEVVRTLLEAKADVNTKDNVSAADVCACPQVKCIMFILCIP